MILPHTLRGNYTITGARLLRDERIVSPELQVLVLSVVLIFRSRGEVRTGFIARILLAVARKDEPVCKWICRGTITLCIYDSMPWCRLITICTKLLHMRAASSATGNAVSKALASLLSSRR